MFGALAEFEREYIRASQVEGIAIAKKLGKYHGRPAKEYDKKKFNKAVTSVKIGKKTATSVIKKFKITTTTYYRWVKKLEKENAHLKVSEFFRE